MKEYIYRDSIKVPIQIDENKVVINNLVLEGGDTIIIPSKNNTVKIIGKFK